MGEEGQPSGGEERMLSEAELLNSSDIDAAFREFLGEMRGVDRDNEVERILRAFKLNPYEQLGVRFDATDDDIKKTYRKKSLMVHPDKCKHPNAKEAFEILGIANKFLTGGGDAGDAERLADLREVLEHAREELRREVKKEKKDDVTAKLAALIHENGMEGVKEEYERSEEFHDRWRAKSREMLAQAEWRRRRITQRHGEETSRLNKQLEEMDQKERKAKEEGRKWEKGRDKRVGAWRDFMKTKGTKVVKKTGMPKNKAQDEDRLYVRRAAATEDHFKD